MTDKNLTHGDIESNILVLRTLRIGACRKEQEALDFAIELAEEKLEEEIILSVASSTLA